MAVVVLDARSGELRSANLEARRVMGELGLPIESLQELLAGGTYRRTDGQEISQRGMSLEAVLRSGETVRGEEMTIAFPNGHKMTAIVDATPIAGADGRVDAVVVTARDMGPLAEMDQFFRIIDEQADYMRELLADLIDIVRIETGTLAVSPEPQDLSRLIDEARTTFQGAGTKHIIRVDLPPDLPLVMADRRRVVQLVGNLLANAARHRQAPRATSSPLPVGAPLRRRRAITPTAATSGDLTGDRRPMATHATTDRRPTHHRILN